MIHTETDIHEDIGFLFLLGSDELPVPRPRAASSSPSSLRFLAFELTVRWK